MATHKQGHTEMLVKTRIKAPKNNNRFRVTVKYEREVKPYHTFVLEGYSDSDLLAWLEERKTFWQEIDMLAVIDKIEWVDDEGIVYAVTGYEETQK